MIAYHRDPIQRDPIYDALDAIVGKKSPANRYGSALLWGVLAVVLFVGGMLLIAFGSRNILTSHFETTEPFTNRNIAPPSFRPAVPSLFRW